MNSLFLFPSINFKDETSLLIYSLIGRSGAAVGYFTWQAAKAYLTITFMQSIVASNNKSTEELCTSNSYSRYQPPISRQLSEEEESISPP